MHNIIPKVAFFTLGCKLNFAETSTISRFFIDEGFEIVSFKDYSDYYVINTCSVTSNADKKSRNAISRALSKNKNAIIIVTGCYAQLKAEEIKNIYGVDYIFGVNDKSEISKVIKTKSKNMTPSIISHEHKEMKTFFPAYSKGDRTRSFLKVQDGCDYFCSYCTIPYARGRSRNQSIEKTIEQANNIAQERIKEVIISGVNIGDFGKSTGENFFQLIQALANVNGIERYRIGSIEPNLITDEIIEFVASNKKFMPHFHIPLQAGCNEMLKIMNRKYDTDLYKYKIDKIKKLIPQSFIGIDLIVGVNGETKEYFEETLNFVNSLDISFIHYFQYSERDATMALNFKPRPSSEEKHNRAKLIKEISDKKHYDFLKNNIGSLNKVLFESTRKADKMYGYTENYIKVEADYNKEFINKVINVELIDFADIESLKSKII